MTKAFVIRDLPQPRIYNLSPHKFYGDIKCLAREKIK
jgi:hypothetical protein